MVTPNGQADQMGVKIGWKIIRVNGRPVPNDGPAIINAMKETLLARQPTKLLFEFPQETSTETKDPAELSNTTNNTNVEETTTTQDPRETNGTTSSTNVEGGT